MSLKRVNTVLVAAFVLFILWFGTEFVVSPEVAAEGFGLPRPPAGDGGGFLVVKGIRDIVLALVLAVLLVTGHRRALGWVLLVEAFAAYGDMATVLAHHGSVPVAFLVHGLTATAMAATGLLVLRETREARGARGGAVAPSPAPRTQAATPAA
ncbi:DUF4267 domain-containing protein [Streptomyces sp. SID5785]|uniref:DUF4267 domain-containing protein n=1 Tax=Streptomyces sp. SID5785 TaxID=2690309 RepID=UPI0013613A5D|nr:DUF4267 domain-containing protein [Streptomyces sp. SID5785]MZD10262.1 DUF4267 domain-containing protein [Streptomyces sp. SID5785]